MIIALTTSIFQSFISIQLFKSIKCNRSGNLKTGIHFLAACSSYAKFTTSLSGQVRMVPSSKFTNCVSYFNYYCHYIELWFSNIWIYSLYVSEFECLSYFLFKLYDFSIKTVPIQNNYIFINSEKSQVVWIFGQNGSHPEWLLFNQILRKVHYQ